MTKIEIPEIISLFPLPTTVLFPQTHLPLHIFEPRYREMVRDALDAHRLIAHRRRLGAGKHGPQSGLH